MTTILKAVAVSVMIATLGSGFVAYSLLRRADTTGLLVVTSHQALEATEETLRRALDAESGLREFSGTRDRASLVPFQRADQMIQHAIDDLERHVGDQPERERVRRLRTEVNALMLVLKRRLGRIENHAEQSGEDLDQTRAHLDAIRATVRDIRRAESERLTDRVAADQSASRRVDWVAIVAAAISAALVTAGGAIALLVFRPGWGRSAS